MFKPLNGRVLVKPDEKKDQTEFGFVLPDKEEAPVSGVVVVGGDLVKKGERVLFSKYGHDSVEIEKETHCVVAESTILGIFTNGTV